MNRNLDNYEEDEEISEFHVDPGDQLEELDVSVDSVNTKKRGRPKLAELWTGVINLDRDNLSTLKMRDLATDLMLA